MASRWIGPRQTTVPLLLFRPPVQNFPDMVELLLEHRADVEKATHDGFTPLLVSAQNGNLKITEILLEKRADINKADEGGQTPLIMAAYFGHKEVVMTLLAAGPDKEVTTASGWTALSIARHQTAMTRSPLCWSELQAFFFCCRANWASAPK